MTNTQSPDDLRKELDEALSKCAGYHIRFKGDRRQVVNAILPIIEQHHAQKIERMREALKPFADLAGGYDQRRGWSYTPDHADACQIGDASGNKRLTVGDLRRARAILNEEKKDGLGKM